MKIFLSWCQAYINELQCFALVVNRCSLIRKDMCKTTDTLKHTKLGYRNQISVTELVCFFFCQTNIPLTKFNLCVLCKQYILSLDVSVDDFMSMEVRQTLRNRETAFTGCATLHIQFK